jgi:hypothetical protein
VGAVNQIDQFSAVDNSSAPKLTPAQGRAGLTPWIWAAALMSLGSSVALMLWYWPGAIPLDVASGVWTALAKDFADGHFYRPVFDGMTYGGTRYMPLFFMLHGTLIHWSWDPVSSGLFLTVVSLLAFDLAIYFALRAIGVRPGLAIPLAVLGHATISVQLLTINVKADLLAAAMNLSTFTLALRYAQKPSRGTLIALTLTPVLAVLTRLPAGSGLVMALVVIYNVLGIRRAAGYALGVAATFVGIAAILYFASDGRIFTSFMAVASGGGGTSYAMRFVLWFGLVIVQDPFFLLLFGAALWYAGRWTDRMPDVPQLYFWIALALTIPLFVSRGIDNNHLLDLLAASILVVGAELSRTPRVSSASVLVPLTVGVLNAAMWIPGLFSLRGAIEGEGRPSRQEIASIAALTRLDGAPMLSENPIVSVLAGERPVVADPFSLRVVANDRSDVRSAFSRQLGSAAFDAVVLVDWSGTSKDSVFHELRSRTDVGSVRFYGDVHFPPETLDLLARHYEVSAVKHPFVILTPRHSAVGSFAAAHSQPAAEQAH